MLYSTLIATGLLIVKTITAPTPVPILCATIVDANGDSAECQPQPNRTTTIDGIPWTVAQKLDYALKLERIQDVLFRQIQNFTAYDFINSGFADSFYPWLTESAVQNAAHVQKLTAALELLDFEPSPECTYDFASIEGATQWTIEAKKLSGILASAWLHLRPTFTVVDSVLTTVTSIVDSDLSQNAALRAALKLPATPASSLTALPPYLILHLASEYVISCPGDSSSARVIPPIDGLDVKFDGPSPVKAGTGITLSVPKLKANNVVIDADVFSAFLTNDGPAWFDVDGDVQDGWKGKVPEGPKGQSYVILNEGKTAIDQLNILAGPAVVEVAAP